MITGTTIYSTTDSNSVPHGTVIADNPSNSPTIGANANTMIPSFSATWLRVKFGSPSDKFDHTNTIAVHGAAASKISPAIYDAICASGRYGRNNQPTKTHPNSAIENGFTAQLMNSVTPIPRQYRRTPANAPKSIFISMGMTISHTSTATGRLTCATSRPPTAWNTPGITCPSPIPTTMHSATQRVR